MLTGQVMGESERRNGCPLVAGRKGLPIYAPLVPMRPGLRAWGFSCRYESTYHVRMFGSHLSVAGGLHWALHEARKLGLQCVQIFTKNQRQWSAPPLTLAQLDAWHSERQATGLDMVVSHDSYLINLAAGEGETRRKSILLMRDEIQRCEQLHIPFLVTHPGSHVGQGEEIGLSNVVRALDQIHGELAGYRTRTCLEITAGQGTGLGYRFEHLRRILQQVREPERLGICLDTAHLLAAGYDLTCATGMRAVLAQAQELIGLDRIQVLHLNDSKVPRGKRVDRHEHIGLGYVSLEAFSMLIHHPLLKKLPKILETPKEDHPDGRPWDRVNLEVLRGLQKPA